MTNREKRNAYQRKWRKNNLEKAREIDQRAFRKKYDLMKVGKKCKGCRVSGHCKTK